MERWDAKQAISVSSSTTLLSIRRHIHIVFLARSSHSLWPLTMSPKKYRFPAPKLNKYSIYVLTCTVSWFWDYWYVLFLEHCRIYSELWRSSLLQSHHQELEKREWVHIHMTIVNLRGQPGSPASQLQSQKPEGQEGAPGLKQLSMHHWLVAVGLTDQQWMWWWSPPENPSVDVAQTSASIMQEKAVFIVLRWIKLAITRTTTLPSQCLLLVLTLCWATALAGGI